MKGLEHFDQNIKAKLVYDEQNLYVPEDMVPHRNNVPMPSEDFLKLMADKGQMQGSNRERLCEMAGRVCYDSLGKGRNSAEYWEHIRQVGHLSVIEHAYFTVLVEQATWQMMAGLFNRRGLWVRFGESIVLPSGPNIRLTFNLRTLLEWERWTDKISAPDYASDRALQLFYRKIYPLIQPRVPLILPPIQSLTGRAYQTYDDVTNTTVNIVPPRGGNECHISMFLAGSRGFSHEMVRHRENMSQRSTRYVDEDGSPWVEHPNTSVAFQELQDSLKSAPSAETQKIYEMLSTLKEDCLASSRLLYVALAAFLEKRAIGLGIDKQTARKQARGAARGYLGNALYTEMIYTTSVNGWRDIIRLRLNDAADAEIRVLFAKVLSELKQSQYHTEFQDMSLVPAKDGLGFAVKEG